MVYLPNEIINLILSYREINPVSLLIKKSVSYYKYERKEDRLFSYYFDTLIIYKMDKLATEHYIIKSHLIKIQLEIERLENMKTSIRWTILKMDVSMLNKKQKADIDIEAEKGFLQIDRHLLVLELTLENVRKLQWINEKKGADFSRFYGDINHSIICCGEIKKGYLVMNNFKNYDEYDNKYRNEIYSKCDRKKYNKKKNILTYYPHLLE